MTTALLESSVDESLGQKLSLRLGRGKYKLWFESARLEADENTLRVGVPNRYAADWIGRHFQGELLAVAVEEIGSMATVAIEVDGAITPAPRSAKPPASSPAPPPPKAAGGLATHGPEGFNSTAIRHSLDDFVVGASNRLAYTAACQLVHDAEGRRQALFVHGGCGLGKTHLLQGLCKRFLDTHPAGRVCYTPAEQFTNQYIHAVRGNRLGEFRRRLRRLDLLAIDDVHFLAAKTATQSEFLHTFDALDLGGARLVLASDAHPKLIAEMAEGLVSRFMGGMVVRIEDPDLETRTHIIEALAKRRGMHLLESVAPQLARQTHGSVREIEGMLTKLAALAAIHPAAAPAPIGHALVSRLLDRDCAPVLRRPARIEQILAVVCERLEVDRSKLMGRSRHRRIVLARSVVVHLARKMTTMSYPEIARAMGRTNHSTIVTAAQRIDRQIHQKQLLSPADTELAGSVEQLVDHLRRAVIEEASKPG